MHFFVREWGVFDVYHLFELTKDVSTTYIPIKEALPMLDIKVWDDYVEGVGTMVFTPNDIIEYKTVHSNDHWIRVMSADLSYPLLAVDQTTIDNKILYPTPFSSTLNEILGKYDIVDGMHRLAKASILKYDTIPVKIVPWDIIMKSKIIDRMSWNVGLSQNLIKSDKSGHYHF